MSIGDWVLEWVLSATGRGGIEEPEGRSTETKGSVARPVLSGGGQMGLIGPRVACVAVIVLL